VDVTRLGKSGYGNSQAIASAKCAFGGCKPRGSRSLELVCASLRLAVHRYRSWGAGGPTNQLVGVTDAGKTLLSKRSWHALRGIEKPASVG